MFIAETQLHWYHLYANDYIIHCPQDFGNSFFSQMHYWNISIDEVEILNYYTGCLFFTQEIIFKITYTFLGFENKTDTYIL